MRTSHATFLRPPPSIWSPRARLDTSRCTTESSRARPACPIGRRHRPTHRCGDRPCAPAARDADGTSRGPARRRRRGGVRYRRRHDGARLEIPGERAATRISICSTPARSWSSPGRSQPLEREPALERPVAERGRCDVTRVLQRRVHLGDRRADLRGDRGRAHRDRSGTGDPHCRQGSFGSCPRTGRAAPTGWPAWNAGQSLPRGDSRCPT